MKKQKVESKKCLHCNCKEIYYYMETNSGYSKPITQEV